MQLRMKSRPESGAGLFAGSSIEQSPGRHGDQRRNYRQVWCGYDPVSLREDEEEVKEKKNTVIKKEEEMSEAT